jgi:hypothetical protein
MSSLVILREDSSKVKPAIFGAAQEIRIAISIEIHNSWADVMTFDISAGDRPLVFHDLETILIINLP